MSQKRILHLITGLDVGGAETMLLKTLPHLQKYFQNEVCCIRGSGIIGKALENHGVPVHYLDLRIFNFPFVIMNFRVIVKQFKPDLLVTYLIHADIFGRVFGKLFGIRKIICNQRGFYLDWKFLRHIDRWTTFLVDQYIVQTIHAQTVLMNVLRLPREKFSIIPNTVDLQSFQISMNSEINKTDLHLPNDNSLLIICVSNLKPRKGYEELLEAFEKTYLINNKIRLLIVGDGSQLEKYLQQIKNYTSKNNIHFLGRQSDVYKILRMCDIFVLGTYSEGMSNAIMEAMSTKLPIITTDIEVNQELIQHEVSGLLVPINDPDALARAMLTLIQDKEKRVHLGKNAYKVILNNFEIRKVVPLIKKTYEGLLYES